MDKTLDLTITSLDTITAWGMDGSFRFFMDELSDAKITNAQEKQDITGKGGRKLNSLKKNKSVTVSGTNGLISSGMLEAQTGSTFESKDNAVVAWQETLSVTGNAAATTYKAVGTAGAEITELRIKKADGTLGAKLTQAESAAAGKYSYNPSTKALAFNSGDFTDGDEVYVFYNRKVAADVLTNLSDKYSEKLQLYIDATGEDKCANIYRVQFYIPKADFSGDFDLQMGGDQATHAFEAESLAGACGTSGGLWTYTVFGANAADA